MQHDVSIAKRHDEEATAIARQLREKAAALGAGHAEFVVVNGDPLVGLSG